MPSSADRAAKRARLAEISRGPVLLTSHEALTWYLEGARTHISLAAGPVLAVRADADGDVLFVPENEADRMIAEELLPEDAANVVRVPWHASPAEAAAQAGPSTPESAIAHELRAARASLLPAELDRYRALGADAARVLTDVLGDAKPEHSEFAVAAALAEGLTAVGAEATVLLVAGASRLSHRHPLPTEASLGDRAMAVVCARRNGLIANVTRWVGAAHDGDDRILEVEADTFDATVPGARLVDLLDVIVRSYPAHGFSQDEWLLHHQGGPTGYAGRDPRVVPGVPDVVVERQAFAWNPTGPGVKVEDTVVVTAGGVEVLSVDERWPTVEVRGRRRPSVRPFS